MTRFETLLLRHRQSKLSGLNDLYAQLEIGAEIGLPELLVDPSPARIRPPFDPTLRCAVAITHQLEWENETNEIVPVTLSVRCDSRRWVPLYTVGVWDVAPGETIVVPSELMMIEEEARDG